MQKSTLLRVCLAGTLLVSNLSCTLDGMIGLTGGNKPTVGKVTQQVEGKANALHAEIYMLEKFMETVTTDLVWKTIIAQNIIWTPTVGLELAKEVAINPIVDSGIDQISPYDIVTTGTVTPVPGFSTQSLSPEQLQRRVDALPKGTFTLVYDGVRGYKIRGVERNTPPDATVLKYDGGPLNTLVTKFKGAKVEQSALEKDNSYLYNVLVSNQPDDGIDLWGKPTRETNKITEIQQFAKDHPEQVAALLEVTSKVVDKSLSLAQTYGKNPEKATKAEDTIAFIRDVAAAAKAIQADKDAAKDKLKSQNPALAPIIDYINSGGTSTGDTVLDAALAALFKDAKKYKDVGFGDENNPSKISYKFAAQTERNKDANEITIKTFIPELKADFAFDPDIYNATLQAIVKANCEKMNLAISGEIKLVFPTVYKLQKEAECALVAIEKGWHTYQDKKAQSSSSPPPSNLEIKVDRPRTDQSQSPDPSKDGDKDPPTLPTTLPTTLPEACTPANDTPFAIVTLPDNNYQITYTQYIDTVKDIVYNEALNNTLATLSELSGVEIPEQEPIFNCTKPDIMPSGFPSIRPTDSTVSTKPVPGISIELPILPTGSPIVTTTPDPTISVTLPILPTESPIVTTTPVPTTSPTTRTPQSYLVNLDTNFSPSILNIYVGDTVVWKNNALLTNRVLQNSALSINETITKNGGTYPYKFNSAGNYTFNLQTLPATMTVNVTN